MSVYDAILIGAGHNGLVCAAYLAKAGKKVLVIEGNETAGGMAMSAFNQAGINANSGFLLNSFNRNVVKDLGVSIDSFVKKNSTIYLGATGRHLKKSGSQFSALSDLKVTEEDRAGIALCMKDINKFARLLYPLMLERPSRFNIEDKQGLFNLAKFGLKMRLLGAKDMREFLRIALLNIADFLEDQVDDPQLAAAAAIDACWGTQLAPRSPGTVLSAIYRETGKVSQGIDTDYRISGGVDKFVAHLKSICDDLGVSFLFGEKVDQIVTEEDHVSGVKTKSGNLFLSKIVASNADPRTTMLELLGVRELDINFSRRLNNIRDKGTTARMAIKLDRPFEIAGVPASEMQSRFVYCPSIHYAELAFNNLKYQEIPEKPPLEIFVAEADPNLITLNVQYVPYALKQGWTDDAKAKLSKNIFAILDTQMEGFSKAVLQSELHTPHDIALSHNSSGGHWHHVEMQVDQLLMMRPIHGSAQYETPIKGLFLCGAGAHPGGNLTGLPGRNAAKSILDLYK
ncbi:MAG: NAD(P)/FAD-dependent oxidoreductase [Alphaproteobacteria bacterium]|nr:NAD(P)/FAD-dependent oxidoreductase [Alphaproteobacteria bacterium]